MIVQAQLVHPILPDDEVAARLDPTNLACAFHESRYVGNRQAVDEILDQAYSAFQSRCPYSPGYDGCPRLCKKRLVFLGPPSAGKTSFARIFAKQVLEMPYCETVPEQLTSSQALFDLLCDAFLRRGIEIVPEDEQEGGNLYVLPPGVLFIDEVHLLSNKVQDSLLKMTEADDGMLLVEEGEVDCRNLCIIIATTDKGKLRPAFKTRFRPITFRAHNTAEIAQILSINQPSWSAEDCLAVAKLKITPREAKDFAESVNACANRRQIAVAQAIPIVAQREGVHEGGVNSVALRALKMLRDAPEGLSVQSLCSALRIENDEFENDCKPCLVANDLHPAFIKTKPCHQITEEGLAYLQGK